MQRELSRLALRTEKPRRIGDSRSHVSILGELKRETDQAGPWEEASGLKGSQARNSQGRARNLHFHRNKGKTVFQDQVNKRVKKSKA